MRVEYCTHCSNQTGRFIKPDQRPGRCGGCESLIMRFGTAAPGFEDDPADYHYYTCVCGVEYGNDFVPMDEHGAPIPAYVSQDEENRDDGFLWVELEGDATPRDVHHLECTGCGREVACDWDYV